MNVIHGLKFPDSGRTQIPYFGVNGTCLVLHYQIAVFLSILGHCNLLVFAQVHIRNVHAFPEGVDVFHPLLPHLSNMLAHKLHILFMMLITITQPGVQ